MLLVAAVDFSQSPLRAVAGDRFSDCGDRSNHAYTWEIAIYERFGAAQAPRHEHAAIKTPASFPHLAKIPLPAQTLLGTETHGGAQPGNGRWLRRRSNAYAPCGGGTR